MSFFKKLKDELKEMLNDDDDKDKKKQQGGGQSEREGSSVELASPKN